MPTLEIDSPLWSLEIESDQYLNDKDEHVGKFINFILAFNKAIELESFEFTRQPGGEFKYEVKAEDGKEWLQTININPSSSSMNFDVEDFWTLTEFAPHRPVRDICIIIARELTVSKIEMTFNS
jgi:hypothetical protein